MRSTNNLIIAVTECKPCTDEELRFCISALTAMLHFAEKAANEMSDGIEGGGTSLKHKVCSKLWHENAEGRFKAIKMPVDKYLGTGNMPGSPEQVERMRFGKALIEKVLSDKAKRQ
jgi:hypothetical protein